MESGGYNNNTRALSIAHKMRAISKAHAVFAAHAF